MKALISRLIIIISLICSLSQKGLSQTAVTTSANSTSTNGVTAGPLISGQTNIVAFGVKVACSSAASLNISQLIITGPGGYFTNARIYRSALNSVTYSGSTLIATFSGYTNTYNAYSIPTQTLANGQYYTFFLVVDLTPSYGNVPGTGQFALNANGVNNSTGGAQSGINYTISAATVTITANTEGVNSQTTLYNGQTGVVLHGITLTTNSPTTIANALLNYTTNLTSPKTSYFPTLALYIDSVGTSSFSGSSVISSATFGQSGNVITVDNIGSITLNPGTNYTFYLVATCAFTGTTPVSATIDFTKIFSYSPSKTYTNSAVNTSKSFTLKTADIAVTGYNDPTANGITPGSISYGQTGIVLFGFGLTIRGSITINTLDIGANTNLNTYFSSESGVLYKSTTSSFADAVPISGSTSTYGTSARISGLNEVFSADSSITNYYFLVASFTANNTYTAPTTLTLNFTGGNAINASTGKPIAVPATTNGRSFPVINTYEWRGGVSSDWNNTANFKTINNTNVGSLPSSSIAVRIGAVTYTNAPVISNADATVGQLIFGSVQNNPTLTVTSPRKITVNSGIILMSGAAPTITGTGTVDILSSGLSSVPSGATLNLTSTAKLSNAGSFVVNGTLTIAGTTTNTGTFTLGSNTTSFGALTNSSGGSLITGTGQLNISGNFSNAGTLTQGTGTIAFNGTSAQSLVNTSATAVTFSKVTFSGAGAKTINSGTGNFAVASTGLLTMTSPATLSAGPTTTGVSGYLTLKSDASGSATVTSLAAYGTTKPITGNVNVERYFTGGESYSRGYRVISSPVSISSTNLVLPSLSYIKAQAYTTGSSIGSNGFDAIGAPTFYFYRENMVPAYTSFLSGNFRGVATLGTGGSFTIDIDNTTPTLPAGNGFLFFFRGNRASNATVDPSVIAQTATFTATGFLNQGSITVTHWAAAANSGKLLYTNNIANEGIRGYNLVGNPYASSIDWDKFGTAAITGTNIDSTIRIYNPRLKAYATYIAGHAGIGVNFDDSSQPNANIIASGQGFFVKAKDVNPTLTFTEAAKVNTQVTSTSLLMSAPASSAGIMQQQKVMGQSLMGNEQAVETAVSSSEANKSAKPVMQYIRLEIVKDANNKDQSIIFFKNGAKPHFVKNEDAEYMKGNNIVNLSTRSSDSKELAINEIAYPAKSFTIPLTIKVPSTGIYQINSTDVKNIPPLYSIWLMDKWRKDSLDIKANKTYNFNVNLADTTSFSPNRFTIVVRQNPELALALTKFTAAKSTIGAQLNWATVNESNYTAFTVERSTDNGKSWDIVGALQSSGKGKYALLDRYPVTGANQYRLKMMDLSGNVSYSAINELMFTRQGESIAVNNVSIYPNPVSTTLNVAIVPQKGATSYTITVTSGNGTLVRSATTADVLWQNNVNNLMPGSYFVQVVNNNTKTIVGNGKFVKN